MTKKILFFLSLSVFSFVQSMERKGDLKRDYVVYSHGFGEGSWYNDKNSFAFLGDESYMPVYPDAPGQLQKAVFYTKPAVHTLANDLHEIAQKEDCESIRLVGRSCGAGTALNCLAKLANYDKNSEYFNGSGISSKGDADKIMQKINKGAFVATAPFLHVRKANGIAIPSKILAGASVAGATAAACYYGPSLCKNSVDPEVAKWGFLSAGLATYYAFGDCIKKMYEQGIVNWIVPSVTNGHFDPRHDTPLQSVEQLRGKLTCPKLLHFNAQDWVFENPDEDTIKVYDALKDDKTHIIITDDAWHNSRSHQFAAELKKFNQKYLKDQNDMQVNIDMQVTQPTVKDLRRQIHAQQSFVGNNAPYLAGSAVIGIPLALGTVYKKMRE